MHRTMHLGLLFMQQSNINFKEKANTWFLRLFHSLDHGETLIRLINHFSCSSTLGSSEMRDNRAEDPQAYFTELLNHNH